MGTSGLNSSTNFYTFQEASGSSNLEIKEKNNGKSETVNFVNINKVYAVGNKMVAVAEAYNIVQEKKSSLKNQIIRYPKHQFIKMWPVNNLNYNDYNIHLFSRRMEDVAAYQFKKAYTFLIEGNELKITDLEL